MSILKFTKENKRAGRIISKIQKTVLHLFPESTWGGKLWVAGGAVQSIVSKTPVNDYDIFLKNSDDVDGAISGYVQTSIVCFTILRR